MKTDFHCHALPQMDDGAQNINESVAILQMLKNQGISRVALTPHYYWYCETVSAFSKRRAAMLGKMNNARSMGSAPGLAAGAEVCLTYGLSLNQDLSRLCYEGTNSLLLELPFRQYQPWVAEEIYNIMYGYSITPLLAHFDRYISYYTAFEIKELVSIPSLNFQINNDALFRRKTLRFVLELIRNGFPVVFGSDSHNIKDRAPNFDQATTILKPCLTKSQFNHILDLEDKLWINSNKA